MTTTIKRSFLPHEGLYIYPIIKGLRKPIFQPHFTLSCLLLVSEGSFSSITPYGKLVQITAAASALLWLNDWLSTKSRNNWVSDKSWNWKKELVVRLAAMGSHPENKRISYYKCDLSDENEIAAVCEKIRSEIGDPTVLPNNAGLSRGQTVVEGTYNDNSITLRTNLLARFLLSKEVLPAMRRQNQGHIFNVASVSAYIPPPGLVDYAASKAGLIAFHECLAQELRVQNAPKVRTSLAVLSFTKTPLFKGETNLSRGLSQTIFLPAIFGYLCRIRATDWVKDLVRGGTRYLKVDFQGRQIIDPQTGRLVR
ncbi:short chain dehydrogenase/reductase family protein [Aspergillus foveolatus]|uniref:short chain dehydrogenase/reductase family protein n=1 Tax=Aspergillus foveolatus TaxID=210207 RepID=UPI003CCCFC85